MYDQSLSIDVHVLVSPSTPKAWVLQCLDSISLAISQSPVPVQLFVQAGVDGHIGKGRWLAYQQGSAPYVTYVDDDDYIEPSAFAVIAKALQSWPDAVFPKEQEHCGVGNRPGHQRHHLPVYRRIHIIDHRPYPCAGDIAQIAHVANLNVIDLPDVLYHHRIYKDSKARAMRRVYPSELNQCLSYPAATPYRSNP